jgi:hypothetical protein
MGREPWTFSILGVIVQTGSGRFQVTLRATAIDHQGPEASFVERAVCPTRQDAKEKGFEMVRELTARLAQQGHKVVDVNTDF